MAAIASPRDKSRFVFRGTVRKSKGATLRELARQPDTAVVRIDQIVRGPDVLTDFTGRDITVKLIKGRPLKAGSQAIFFTNAWVMADGLAVEALDYETAAAAPGVMAMATTTSLSAPDNLHRHDVESRVASADAVVAGRVAAVRVVDDPAPARVVAAAARRRPTGTSTTRVSEHAPLWREAVIDVTHVYKGTHLGKTAVVRFPASTDVRWHRAAKFEPGQEGFFMLHKTGPTAARRQTAAAAGVPVLADHETAAFTALHPADFQPFNASDDVKKIIAGESPPDPLRPRAQARAAGVGARARRKRRTRRG
jgi:hypothetical protein